MIDSMKRMLGQFQFERPGGVEEIVFEKALVGGEIYKQNVSVGLS